MTNEGRVQPRVARTTWGVAWRSGLAGLILQLSIIAALLLQGLIQAGLPGHMARRIEDFGVYIGLGALLLCGSLGGALWAWLLARIVRLPERTRVAWAGAIVYGPFTVITILLLNEAELYFVEGAGRYLLSVHIAFAIVFTLAAAAMAALAGAAIGIALRDRRLALKLALSAGVIAGGVFLLADMVQDLLGRRVGGINAAATATMLTVMLVGNILASLAASAVIGAMLHRWLARR
jgi:hypothetical protein